MVCGDFHGFKFTGKDTQFLRGGKSNTVGFYGEHAC